MNREQVRELLNDLPANPIVDEIQDAFEVLFRKIAERDQSIALKKERILELDRRLVKFANADIEVRALRKDRERLDWLDANEVTLILHGPHRTSIAAREVIDAAMASREEN